MVADRLFRWMLSPNDTAHIKDQSASEPLSNYSEIPLWHYNSHGAVAACDAMKENDSTRKVPETFRKDTLQ